jgi:hypothetical protein
LIQWASVLPGFSYEKTLAGMDTINEFTLNYWYPQFAQQPVTRDSLTALADSIVAQWADNTGPPLGAEQQVIDNALNLTIFRADLADYIDLWDTGQANTEEAAELGYVIRGSWMNAFWTLGGPDGENPNADWVVTSGYGHNPTDPQYGIGQYTWFC